MEGRIAYCAMSKIVDDITLLSRRSPLSRWSGIMDTPACTEARNVVGAASPNSNDTRRPRRPLLVTDERQCFLVMDDDDFEQTPVDTLIADDDQLEVWTTFDPLVAGVRDFERSNAEWEHVEPNAATVSDNRKEKKKKKERMLGGGARGS